MTSHLSPETIAALADGELQTLELASAQDHLAGCGTCTSNALAQTLLKSAAARAGQRFETPPDLGSRLSHQLAQQAGKVQAPAPPAPRRYMSGFAAWGWAAAAVLLVASTLSGSWFLMERNARQKMALASTNDALVSEVFDQHVATLAAAGPPQVLSSDNHTVKPWFQGKLPFAFNLPEHLPNGMALDGANLTYLRNQPAAQLHFSIGRHRASVFVIENTGHSVRGNLSPEHSGFHVVSFVTGDLEGIAMSDVNPARLAELVHSLEEVQTKNAQ